MQKFGKGKGKKIKFQKLLLVNFLIKLIETLPDLPEVNFTYSSKKSDYTRRLAD